MLINPEWKQNSEMRFIMQLRFFCMFYATFGQKLHEMGENWNLERQKVISFRSHHALALAWNNFGILLQPRNQEVNEVFALNCMY
jgi:hypothetical protein